MEIEIPEFLAYIIESIIDICYFKDSIHHHIDEKAIELVGISISNTILK